MKDLYLQSVTVYSEADGEVQAAAATPVSCQVDFTAALDLP